MSLKIYTKKSDIPYNIKYVNYNDKFFGMTVLKDDDITKNILKEIDHAVYHSKDTFIGRDKSLGALNKSLLSTGCKTLLNIASHPDICFDTIECGQNALRMLVTLHSGMILWEEPVFLIKEDAECEIEINNRKFNSTMCFAEYIMVELPEGENE